MGDGAVLWAAAAPREGLTGPGRDDALVALFDEHYRGLCQLAALLLDDAGAAEEAVQEAFLRTFAGWRRLRRPDRARWYLRAAVVNQCRSRVRRRATEDRGNRVAWSSEHREGEPPDDDALAVLDAVRCLPPRQQEAVVLHYYEDLTERETAAALGCSVGTVKSQLSKARATLAARLGEDGDG
ncbi:MAG: SigE family RNA polymerase sigma factor [Acidimicrobiales bacterium]